MLRRTFLLLSIILLIAAPASAQGDLIEVGPDDGSFTLQVPDRWEHSSFGADLRLRLFDPIEYEVGIFYLPPQVLATLGLEDATFEQLTDFFAPAAATTYVGAPGADYAVETLVRGEATIAQVDYDSTESADEESGFLGTSGIAMYADVGAVYFEGEHYFDDGERPSEDDLEEAHNQMLDALGTLQGNPDAYAGHESRLDQPVAVETAPGWRIIAEEPGRVEVHGELGYYYRLGTALAAEALPQFGLEADASDQELMDFLSNEMQQGGGVQEGIDIDHLETSTHEVRGVTLTELVMTLTDGNRYQTSVIGIYATGDGTRLMYVGELPTELEVFNAYHTTGRDLLASIQFEE